LVAGAILISSGHSTPTKNHRANVTV